MPRKWLVPALFVLFLSGCASVPLHYDHPNSGKPSSTQLKIALTYPDDKRLDRESMDKVLKNNLVDDLSKIIAEEIQSTGLFSEVVPIAKEIPPDKAPEVCKEMDLIMHSCLTNMAWEVPDYEEIQTTSFLVGFAFGLAGGVVYGMTKTDVYGNANLKITVFRQNTRDKLIDKDYVARVKERMAKLNCDSFETRSTMAGKAIKSVMDQFKEDLEKTVRSM